MSAERAIKAIIFDFGGVLLGKRSEEERRYWAERLGLERGRIGDVLFGGEEWSLAKVGAISKEEFWQRVGPKLGLHTAEEIAQFRQEYFAGERMDQQLVDWARQLKGKYKLAVLSNASGDVEDLLRDRFGIGDLFDLVVDSARVGVAKPERAIYELALERLDVAPHEAVFVDDLAENVTAAATMGLRAVHHLNTESTLHQLHALLEDTRPEFAFAIPMPEDYSAMAALCRGVASEFWWSPVLVLAQYPSELEIAALCSDEEYIVRVARVSGQVVAIALLLQPSPAPLHHTAELSLAVAPEYRRYGIGRALVEYLLDLAPASGIELVRAWVCAANGPSRALLEGLGFECGARLGDELRRPDGRNFDVLIYHRFVGHA
ncbi:MAG: HAD-IA family hydrolase [Anaerolineae bacterium]|nr:HAD-IA family hydrolase [Anaerolineae bacterium]MDH7473065.1 HAD-IA family hydrolase [Anaerolineae bacterium]